mmetsp:Transcript_3363/g.7902  ORF Transcript_3363/g.7902 Transcript_3363/m.7902 type:complete len:489 (-) Transcript_3363:1052-2518(-)|eukprot:CAMPEP_0178991316 /NCGR_PEP_ID=MMETSP0795-20121207/5452_1 /TAXON_ID=88552 /ORGANISM="Amoebophrya sp., Strain Ameob2" /LENGTH=488 /DNA_ID=CAMNT_0020682995 /DNA_START=1422 /DNA_END=2888 /DNA_ORIENTATION=+
MDQVIVVGGGLAGLSAAHTAMERGSRVLLVDKNPFMGGNSTKATSGINGAGTRTQRAKGVSDGPEVFEEDTIRGGAKSKEHAKVLTWESGPGVEWLIDNFGLDLSLVSRLGGHSQPRTHRGGQKFPGMTITFALMEALEEVAEKQPERARIMLKAKMTKLLKDGKGNVNGLELEVGGKKVCEYGPVVLATGGYGADNDPDSILHKHRPDLKHMPTTCGDHCTGDGIKFAMRDAGADAVDLNWVQVHPTGLVNPKEPDVAGKTLFLAAEALRGCGGLLLDANGKRFANELGRRDYVSGRMFEEKGPFRLCLNTAASKEIAWHCKHYKGRGLMKSYKNMHELAKEMAIDVNVIKQTFDEHNDVEAKQLKDPENGPFDAYGGGKSWDKWGKKFYHNGPNSIEDAYHVAIVCPVVHYTMGGMKVTPAAEAQTKDDKVIAGLFGAGEVNGGIHGENRLGGSSLLDCVVYGRVAGRSACKYLMDYNIQAIRAKM